MHRSVPFSFFLSIVFTVIGIYIAFGVLQIEMNLISLFIVVAIVFSLGIGLGVVGTKSV